MVTDVITLTKASTYRPHMFTTLFCCKCRVAVRCGAAALMIGYVMRRRRSALCEKTDCTRRTLKVPRQWTRRSPSTTTMIKTLPRAAPRTGAFVREAQTPLLCSRLSPIKSWRPVQQQLARRHRSTMRDQFREQFHKSPIMFPFAISMCVFFTYHGLKAS